MIPKNLEMHGDRKSNRLRGGALVVLGFTAAYLLVAVAAALGSGNQEFMLYIGVMVLLVAVAGAVHWRVNFSTGVLWGLSLWGLAHMAGGLLSVPAGWPINGDIRVLYSLWLIPNYLKYDHVVHAYGFGVTTWACWEGLQSILAARGDGREPVLRLSAGMLTLCAAASLGFGALNEIVEFAATLTVPKTNVGGYVNTGWDLVSNFAGIVIASGLLWGTRRRSDCRSKLEGRLSRSL